MAMRHDNNKNNNNVQQQQQQSIEYLSSTYAAHLQLALVHIHNMQCSLFITITIIIIYETRNVTQINICYARRITRPQNDIVFHDFHDEYGVHVLYRFFLLHHNVRVSFYRQSARIYHAFTYLFNATEPIQTICRYTAKFCRMQNLVIWIVSAATQHSHMPHIHTNVGQMCHHSSDSSPITTYAHQFHERTNEWMVTAPSPNCQSTRAANIHSIFGRKTIFFEKLNI